MSTTKSCGLINLAPVNIFPLRHAWTEPELQQLMRFQTELRAVVELDFGLTDEGDPWCAVCETETQEVWAHFARIGRTFIGHRRGARFVRQADTLSAMSDTFIAELQNLSSGA